TGATALGFFALVGFEDSVNMVEETKDLSIFPKILITGLSITAFVYVLVSVVAVAVVPVGELATSETPLLDVVAAGAPGLPIDDIFPYLTIFAVANTALINMLMASRLLYGMANQRVLPSVFGKVLRKDEWGYGDGTHFRTLTALPWLGAATSLFLVGPWARMDALIQSQIAGALLGTGLLVRAFAW